MISDTRYVCMCSFVDFDPLDVEVRVRERGRVVVDVCWCIRSVSLGGEIYATRHALNQMCYERRVRSLSLGQSIASAHVPRVIGR